MADAKGRLFEANAVGGGYARDQFLRIAKFKTLRKNFGIGHPGVTRQSRPDLGRDRIIAVTVPAQNKLGLFPEVFEIGHSRLLRARYG